MATASVTAPPTANTSSEPTLRDYAVVTALLVAFSTLLAWMVDVYAGLAAPKQALVAPMGALLALTGLVWLLMVIFRNYAILRRLAKAEYYRAYTAQAPADWIERPARTFNNLMQVPTLFYVACLLMLELGRVDGAQLMLAWLYVGLRALHAFVYMIWNPLPYRFAAWVASCITLAVLWTRALS